MRTLDFWRSIFAECVATFFYVMLVTSVSAGEVAKGSPAAEEEKDANRVYSALAAGLAALVLTLAFARVSGAHMNPAVTLAMTLIRQVSPLRSILYMAAQCGGGIAGTALVKGIRSTSPNEKTLKDPALNHEKGAFGMEFVLTFLIVYAYCATRADSKAGGGSQGQYGAHHGGAHRGGVAPLSTGVGAPSGIVGGYSSGYRSATTTTYNSAQTVINSVGDARPDPLVVGAAYAGCLLAYQGCLNPARALGAAFVFQDRGSNSSFHQHWVFWVGPLLGGVTGGFAFEYIFRYQFQFQRGF